MSKLKYFYINNGDELSLNNSTGEIYNLFYKEEVFKQDLAIKKDDLLDSALNNEYIKSLRQISRSIYKKPINDSLSSDNVLILTGAGSSIGFGGKSMYGLWQSINENFDLDNFIDTLDLDTVIKDNIKDKWDLELLLSMAKKRLELNDNEDLKSNIQTIENIIRDECKKVNINGSDIHTSFLKRLMSRKSIQSRVKVFTTNYDTAFEQAGMELNSTIIDGFSFTIPRYFDGKFFDYDIVHRSNSRVSSNENFIKNVFHLYKLHGSLNWEKVEDKVIQKSDTNKPMMIYPNSTKYESSYEQPYFEMMNRLQFELRKGGSTTLIVIGFSFADKHIYTMVKQALKNNYSLKLILLNYNIEDMINSDINENFKELYKEAIKGSQVTIIDDTFSAFVETLEDNIYYNFGEDNE